MLSIGANGAGGPALAASSSGSGRLARSAAVGVASLGETGGAAAVTMKVYALYDYATEKREALGKWGELVAKIIN